MSNLRPQIITTRKVLTSLIAPEGARTAAMVGTSQWGPIDTVTEVSTLSNYISIFGDESTAGLTGIKGANQFFNNGGTLKFVRVTDGTEDKAEYMALSTATEVINFIAKYDGTYGNNIYITIEANSTSRNIIVTDGNSREYFSNNGLGYATNEAIETAINAGSNLVTAVVETGQESINLADALVSTQLTGGLDGATTISTTILTTAFDDLLMDEEFNFLLFPGETTDAFYNTMSGKLDNRATSDKAYSRLIGGIAKDETYTTASARTSSGKRLTIVAPNIVATNRYSNSEEILDGSYLACAYTGTLCALDVEVSGTHETVTVEGLSVLESSGKTYYNKNEQNQLLNASIAPITLIGSSLQMVRGITRFSDQTSVYFEEVVNDIVDYVQGELETYLQTVIGKPNTTSNRSAYASELNARLTTFQGQGVIDEYTESSVVAGTSPDIINATVGIKPAYSTNFVLLTININ